MSMLDPDAAARQEIRAKLAQSRAELRALLEPPPAQNYATGAGSANSRNDFPRSRTMQMLMSGRGLGTVGALAGGLLMARPGLAMRLLRMVPATTIAKMALARGITALRSKAPPER